MGLWTNDAAAHVWSWQDPAAWLLGLAILVFARWIHRRFSKGGCDGCA